jgi:CHAT domain-containing protein
VNHALPDLDLLKSGTAINHTLLTPARALSWNIAGASVTMQACVSGLASEGIGGDALGLEWALIQAGAASLLSTHWEVDVPPSVEFCTRFYEKWLLVGLSRAEAWRETILGLIDSRVPLRDWAPFSLSGDWR